MSETLCDYRRGRLDDAKTLLTELMHRSDGLVTAFRGEPAVYPGCLANLDRVQVLHGLPLGQRVAAERILMKRFQRFAPLRVSDVERQLLIGNDKIAVPFGMQVSMRHRGVPTRLLDWTRSVAVAAFFASGVDPARPKDPGLIRICRTDIIEQWAASNFGNETQSWEMPSSQGSLDLFPRLLSDGFCSECGDWIVPFFVGTSAIPRLQEQHGLFTFASRPGVDHWSVIQRAHTELGRSGDACTVVIPTDLKRFVRVVLEQHWNIKATSLFPEIDGVLCDLELILHDHTTKIRELNEHHLGMEEPEIDA